MRLDALLCACSLPVLVVAWAAGQEVEVFANLRLDHTMQRLDVEGGQLFEANLSQLLFSCKLNARTVLFAGYSDNRLGIDDLTNTQTNRTFFLKLGYAWIL